MNIPKGSSLNDYQGVVAQLVLERGFDKETLPEVFTLLVEEVGELAKAIRTANGQKIGEHSKIHEVEEEAADVFWLLMDICNRIGISLDDAFHAKEAINQKRNWK
jgi:NTP pyrophosphatase (non-canonical NTP hydrolase)